MTIKEIIEVTGLSKQTIINKIKEKYPAKIEHGKTTKLNQDESIEVVKELKVEVSKNLTVQSNNLTVTDSDRIERLESLVYSLAEIVKTQIEVVNKSINNNQLTLPMIELKQYTVKEFFKMKKYILISPDYARKAVGKIATDLSKKHSRSIAYKIEDGYDAGMYDEKILETAVTVYRNDRQLEKDLFN